MAAINCFTQVDDTYTKPEISTHCVSAGISCPHSNENITCPLQTGGFLTERATLNITTGSTNKVFDAIEQATGKPFNDPVTGSVVNLTYRVDPGAMGYYGFTGTLNCFAGSLGDCIGGDVNPGTAVEACEPNTLEGTDASGYPELDGTGAFVRTDDISNMTTNPSAMRPHPPTDSSPSNAGPNVRLASTCGVLGTFVVTALLWYLY